MRESMIQRPPLGYGEGVPPASSQRLTHSLDECRSRISELRSKLSANRPTGPAHLDRDASAFSSPHERVLALSPEDQPALNASFTAIRPAARCLLRDLEGPFDGGRTPGPGGQFGGGVHAHLDSTSWEVKGPDR